MISTVIEQVTKNGLKIILILALLSVLSAYYNTCWNGVPATNVNVDITDNVIVLDSVNVDTIEE